VYQYCDDFPYSVAYVPPKATTSAPQIREERPVLSKTIYVNLPVEPTTVRPPKPPVPPQRHYKIVFIKAPTAPPPEEEPEPETTPPPESKTIIYVLHKKPEVQPKIRVLAPVPTQPSKPEVHFIQYTDKGKETTTEHANEPEWESDYSSSSSYANSEDYDHGRGSGKFYSGSQGSPLGLDKIFYDLSSSSSTVHVNVKKSVSDKN
jgi:hypothetical protein